MDVTIDIPEPVVIDGENWAYISFEVPKTDVALDIFDALSLERQDMLIEAIAKSAYLQSGERRRPVSEVLDQLPMQAALRMRDGALQAIMNDAEPERTPAGTYIVKLAYQVKLNEEKRITAIEFKQPTFGLMRDALRINDMRERFYAVIRLTGTAMIEGGDPEPMVDAYTRALSAPDVGTIISTVIADFFG